MSKDCCDCTNRSQDPVFYRLTGEEPIDPDTFRKFLDHLTDVPESAVTHNVPIDEVGITNQRVVVNIADILTGEGVVPVHCNVTLSTNLKDRRGIHMSRCGTSIFDAAEKNYANIDEFARMIAENVVKRQDGDIGVATVDGEYLQRKPARLSGLTTHDCVHLHSEARVFSDGNCEQKTGVRAYNMTTCPCTLTHTRYSTIPALRNAGLSTEQMQAVLDAIHSGTHTQRGTISLLMDKSVPDVNSGTLYNVLDGSVHLVSDVLKRADEHELVIRALSVPQFTEDVVRAVAAGTFNHFNGVAPDQTRLEIISHLLESIHIHDVRTVIRTSLGDLRKVLVP